MPTFNIFSRSGVDFNDLFTSAENIDQENLTVRPTKIIARSDNAIGASRFEFIGRNLDVDGEDLDGTVTEIRFFQGNTEIARMVNASIDAQDLGDAIADSYEETGFEPLLELFSRFTYRFNGDDGDDGFTGGLSKDIIYGNGGSDRLSGELGDDTIRGGEGNDNLSGDYGLSTAYSGDFARGGKDSIHGGVGADTISGDGGNDTIHGEQGDDVLRGGFGKDRLVGGSGSDRMYGGDGADTFLFLKLSESPYVQDQFDQIEDFQHGVDHIDLRPIDANQHVAGNQAFTFVGAAEYFTRPGQVAIVPSGSDFYVAVNTDRNYNDVDFGFFVNFVNTGVLTKGDFFL